jgi:hypothetical protein
MKDAIGISTIVAAALLASALSACGGGGGGGSMMAAPPTAFNLQAGIAHLVTSGQTAHVSLSGSVMVNGSTTAVTGSGTLILAPAVTGTFNGSAALSQTENVSGTVTAAGQSAPLSTSVVDYYATGSDAFLGETGGNEYDVAQTPFMYPTTVVGGSSGILGTVSRYTDNTLGVSLGTTQVSYLVTAPVDPSGPVAVAVTNQIYDTQHNLTETDVTSYSLTTSGVLSLVSASAQQASGNTLKLTAQ